MSVIASEAAQNLRRSIPECVAASLLHNDEDAPRGPYAPSRQIPSASWAGRSEMENSTDSSPATCE